MKTTFDFAAKVVTTACGSVQGTLENGFYAFKGIPYAKAERFMAPQSVTWEGLKDCTEFGKKSMQVYDKPSPWMPPQNREDFDEDCLNLNIYVPENICPDEQLPVFVEIHGGAYQSGSNQDHKPAQMVKDRKVIYVAVNYRLGVLGFLYLGNVLGDTYKTSGNNGILDLLASVKWIYENISAFGGNPDNMTVLGGSAGAKAIGGLMMIPEFNTYVKKVIMSSGATQSIRSIATSEVTTNRFFETACKVLGKKVKAEDVLTMTSDEIIEVQKVFTDNPGNTCMFGPVADGVIISENWEEDAIAGTPWTGRAMIGSSRHELMFYSFINPEFHNAAAATADALFGVNSSIAKNDYAEFVENYVNRNGCEPDAKAQKEEWACILTDYMYRMYSYRLASRLAKKGCDVWQYHVEFLPALHCFDQTLAFTDISNDMFFKTEESKIAGRKTGEKVFDSFLNFVENGNPGMWEPLDVNAPKQMCWDVESEVRAIPEDDVLDHFPEAVYVLA